MMKNNWIPCSERLPESEKLALLCLVTYMDFDFFNHKWGNVKIGVMEYLTKPEIWNTKVYVKVLAWMPLPEPYEKK